jgi:hypothetical protein
MNKVRCKEKYGQILLGAKEIRKVLLEKLPFELRLNAGYGGPGSTITKTKCKLFSMAGPQS